MGLFCTECDYICGTEGAPAVIHALDCAHAEWAKANYARWHPGFDPVVANRDAVKGDDGDRYWPAPPKRDEA
jgi:hypothetical protein